jgi:hypothetical protein
MREAYRAPRSAIASPPFLAHLVAASLAVAAVTALAPRATAAVITIEQPTPAPGVAVPPAGIDTRVGAGVPNTGGVAPDRPAGDAPAGAGPTATVATTTNAQHALRVLETTNAELVAIAGLGAASPVRVVLIGLADPHLRALAEARSQNDTEGERLRAAINTHQMFRGELAANNVDVTRIVAAEVTAAGLLILYALT